MAIERLDGKGVLKYATGRVLEDEDFLNDPIDGGLGYYEMSDEEIKEEMLERGLSPPESSQGGIEEREEAVPNFMSGKGEDE